MQDHFKLNRQLEQNYKINQALRHKIQQRNNSYSLAKTALQIQEDLNISDQILEVFAFQKDYEVFFYYGNMQPKTKIMTPKLTLFLIKNFHPQFNKKYKFVFFNNRVQSNQIYYQFKNIFLTLPLNFFLALDQFIFVKPTFSQKVNQWWTNDQIQKYFKAKTKYVSNIIQLCPLLNTNISKLTQFLPKSIIADEFPEIANNSKTQGKKATDFRINLKGQQRNQKQRTQFNSFIQDISDFLRKVNNQPRNIDEYESNETNLPIILEELFGYFHENPEIVKEEGLFRKCVSIDDQNQTLNELLRSNFQYLRDVNSPHLVASLIKRFFAKLKSPIFPFSSFDNLMHDQGISDKLSLVKEQIALLPSKNYFCLLFLFQFLVENVLPFEKYTKMDSKNLAICFAPCLLWSQKPSELDLIYATKSSHIVKIMLDNFEQIFGDRTERTDKIRQTVKIYRGKWQHQLKLQIKSLSQNEIKSDRQSLHQ